MTTSEAELDDSKTESKNSNRLLQLPIARVKTIMKSSADLGNVSQEAYFLITRATECFVQYMAEEAWKSCQEKKTVQYKQVANIVETDESLEFLEEMVPQKIKVSDYWRSIGYTPEPPTKKSPTKKSPTKKPQTPTTPSLSSPSTTPLEETIVID